MASNVMRSVLTRPSSSSNFVAYRRSNLSGGEIITSHTDKWMQLINEVPSIKVEGRIVACEGDSNPALGHPIEFMS